MLLAHVSRGLIGIHMASIEERAARAAKIASVLRPLGNGVLSRKQAERAAQLLGVHCTTVYRLRRRFLADPVASTLEPSQPGRATGGRLDAAVGRVIDEAVHEWLPNQRHLAHPATDLVLECSERRRCHCITVEEGVARSVSRLLPGAPQPARDCSAIDFRQSSEFRRRAAGDITLSMPTAQAEQNITLAVLVNIASTPLGAASIDCELLQQPAK